MIQRIKTLYIQRSQKTGKGRIAVEEMHCFRAMTRTDCLTVSSSPNIQEEFRVASINIKIR
jgi:hypothetical protein